MVTITKRKEFVLVGEKPCQVDCEIIGLTSRVAQVDTIIFSSQFLTKPLGVLSLPLRKVYRRGVCQLGDLLADYFGDGGMGMPERYCGNTGNEVNVAVTLMVEEIL